MPSRAAAGNLQIGGSSANHQCFKRIAGSTSKRGDRHCPHPLFRSRYSVRGEQVDSGDSAADADAPCCDQSSDVPKEGVDD